MSGLYTYPNKGKMVILLTPGYPLDVFEPGRLRLDPIVTVPRPEGRVAREVEPTLLRRVEVPPTGSDSSIGVRREGWGIGARLGGTTPSLPPVETHLGGERESDLVKKE